MQELKITRILAAVDLGPQSEDILGWARWFAARFGASVDIVHAMTLSLPPYFTDDQIKTLADSLKRQRATVGRRLKQLARKVLGNVPFTVRVQEGYALDVIHATAQQVHPDLLVVGSHGHGGLQRLLLGSVVENIYREAAFPTLVVKSQPPTNDLQRVLCPVNFSELAVGCASYSKMLSERAGADLYLLQAIEELGEDIDRARDRLCQWHREGAVSYPHVTEIVRRGEPVQETISEAESNGIDLIVVGATHRRVFDSLFIGRTTEHIVRLSPISVLVVPGAIADLTKLPSETAVTARANR